MKTRGPKHLPQVTAPVSLQRSPERRRLWAVGHRLEMGSFVRFCLDEIVEGRKACGALAIIKAEAWSQAKDSDLVFALRLLIAHLRCVRKCDSFHTDLLAPSINHILRFLVDDVFIKPSIHGKAEVYAWLDIPSFTVATTYLN